jgi:hypothetical protein
MRLSDLPKAGKKPKIVVKAEVMGDYLRSFILMIDEIFCKMAPVFNLYAGKISQDRCRQAGGYSISLFLLTIHRR